MDAALTEPQVVALMNTGATRTFFQPIVSVRRKMVCGVEALARGVGDDGALLPPKMLFDLAARQGQLDALDRHTRNEALRTYAAREFAGDRLLFLNIDLDAVAAPQRTQELIDLIRALGIPFGSVVVEIVENQFDQSHRLSAFVARVREHGMLIAIDDVGAGHSNLERISLIRPNILKIDRSLCAKLGSDQCTEEVFSALVNLGRRIGALVVAEGIETRQQAMVALERGADMLQGYFILAPQPAEAVEIDQAQAATENLAGHFRQHMIKSINHSKIERRMHSILVDSILTDLALAEASGFTATLHRTIRSHPDVECAYVLDQRGVQVTQTVFNAGEMPPASPIFSPAEAGTDHSLKQYYHALLDNEANRYVTDPYVSLASGHLCRTISTAFRDGGNERMFVLCVDVKAT